MASITITFPDAQRTRIRDALCAHGGYRPKLDDGTDNPVSRMDFAEAELKRIVRGIERDYRRDEARKTADATPDLDLT